MKKQFLIILTYALAVCCTTNVSPYRSQLIQADSLMHTHPDSALTLLQSLSADALPDVPNRAYHALLLSQAFDKNYIDLTDDSLINIAVAYYADKPVSQQQMLAYYYQARIKQNAKAYADAILPALYAEAAALQLNDHYHLGLIYRLMMDSYNHIYIPEKELKYAQLSYEHFARTEYNRYTYFAQLNLATAYTANRKMEQAIELLKPLIEVAEEEDDTILLSNVLSSYSNALMCQDEYAMAKVILLRLQTIKKRPLTTRNYSHLAISYLCENQLDSALYYGAKAKKVIKDDTDRYLYEKFNYLYHKEGEDFENALSAHLKAFVHHDSVLSSAKKQEIDFIVQQFHDEQLQITQKKKLKQFFFVFLILLLIMVAVFALFAWRTLVTRRRLNNETATYLQLQTELQKDLEKMMQQQTAKDTMLNKLYKEKCATIVSLAKRYNHSIVLHKEKDFVEDIKKEIEELKSAKALSQMEQEINHYRNYIIRDLRQQVPDINDIEMSYIIYLQAGFSNDVIEYLLNVNTKKIYNIRARLKVKIHKSKAPDATKFIAELL